MTSRHSAATLAVMAAVLMGAALPQAVNKDGFVSGPIKVTPSGVQTWANLYNSILQVGVSCLGANKPGLGRC